MAVPISAATTLISLSIFLQSDALSTEVELSLDSCSGRLGLVNLLSIASGFRGDMPVASKALRINSCLNELCQALQNRLKKSLLATDDSP